MPASQKRTFRPPRQADVRDVPAAIPDGASPVSTEGARRRKLLLLVLGLLALGAVIAVGGAVALGLGVLRVDDLLPRRAVGSDIVPVGQVSPASFQAAVKECRPIAAVGELHEGVGIDVLVRVEGPVGENCRIYQEVIRDSTGYELTGTHMTCLLPTRTLSTGTRLDGELKDYCEGSFMDAMEGLAQEEP
jgi:hypothetical protein